MIEQQKDDPPIPAFAGTFSSGKQKRLITEVMRAIGFSFERGRLDESQHPFTEGVAGDIRVTTRIDNSDPFSGLLAALHETGHALYDLGIPREWSGQPAGSIAAWRSRRASRC